MKSDEVTEETRAYREVFRQEIQNAVREFNRPWEGLALSSLSAGMNVSFGALFMGMAFTFAPEFSSNLVKQFVLANASAVGFILVILGQTELFTAHTSLGILPVLNGQATFFDLGRPWAVIYVMRLVGCALFAGFIAFVGPRLTIVDPTAFGSLADALLPYSALTTLASGVIAGWLRGLLTWLVAAARDTTGEFLVTWMIASTVGFGPFHHALLGTTEILTAMFLRQGVTVAGYLHFLLWTTVGNIVGGTVFVAGLNYGHAIRGGSFEDVELEL